MREAVQKTTDVCGSDRVYQGITLQKLLETTESSLIVN